MLAGELRDGVGPARLADRADRRDLPLGRRCRRASRRPRWSRSRRSARACRSSRAPPRARCRCRSRSRASSAPGSRARSRRRRSPRSGRSASPARELLQLLGVEDVALVEREVRMVGELGAGEGVAVEVVDRDDLVLVDELPREGGGDEAGPAGDEDPLALSATASSLPAYSSALCESRSTPREPRPRPGSQQSTARPRSSSRVADQ